MKFKKWSSIENSYREDFIKKFIAHDPQLKEENFEITEKIDGANFSVSFTPTGEIGFYKRSGRADSGFYNYKSAFQDEKVKKFISLMQTYCIEEQRNLQFVGELFGRGVQKRLYYGEEVYWRWYAIYEHTENGVRSFSPKEMTIFEHSLFKRIGFSIFDLRVPRIGVMSLEEFLSFEPNFNSSLTPMEYTKENIVEGIVARPMNNYSWGEENFILKKKREGFSDRAPKKERKKMEISNELFDLIETARTYVNDNRTADLFSKHGKIEKMSKFGEYIGLYVKDVLEDFHKDYPLEYDNLDKPEKKVIHKFLVEDIKKQLMRSM